MNKLYNSPMQKNWQRLKSDPSFKEKLLLRQQVIDAIKSFFKKDGYLEVETPLLVKSPGTEPYLEVFATKMQLLDGKYEQGYLLTSPEYAMKKLLAAGMGNIFQICKSFRNQESLGGSHNPEFTILEWYHTEADYLDVMDDFERMMFFIWQQLKKQNLENILDDGKVLFQGKEYQLKGPYPRFTVAELFKKYLNLDKDQLLSTEALKVKAIEKGYDISGLEAIKKEIQNEAFQEEMIWEELYNQLFLNEIETKLAEFNTPVFVYDYPASQAALSKKKKDDPRFAERFEVYMAGLELGNAFSELTDAKEQAERLKSELKLRDELGKTKYTLDEDFIEALEVGMPETGGIAVGVDRLVMLFADTEDINDTLFFPAKELFPSS